MNNANRNRFYVTMAVLIAGLMGLSVFAPAPQPRPQPIPQPQVEQREQPLQVQAQAPAGGNVRHFGYVPNRQATERFIASLPRPFMHQAAPQLLAARDQTPVLLYRALYEAYAAHNNGQQWQVKAQGIGDCVSWGWAHGADIHLAVMWKLGDTSEWRPAATEAIYGGSRVEARGITNAGFSDGSYGAAAAKWVHDWGIVFRERYDTVDLSEYSASRAKQWGAYGCGGRDDQGRLDGQAKAHPVGGVVVVTTFQEAAAAIQSGYPVAVCSGQGFSNARDAAGFCRASGSWAHCMVFIGVRFDRPGLLCLNSWGPSWVKGPKWPDDQPDGSFWVDANVASRMLSGRDSFAISGYRGFPYKNLKNGDWVQVDPAAIDRIERRVVTRALLHDTDHQFSIAP